MEHVGGDLRHPAEARGEEELRLDLVALGLGLHALGDFVLQLRRALLDAGFQVLATLLQRRGLALDLRQHVVEAIDESAELVVPTLYGPHRVVAFRGDHADHAGELRDGAADRGAEARRQQECEEGGHGHDPGDDQREVHERGAHLDEVRLDVERSLALVAVHHGTAPLQPIADEAMAIRHLSRNPESPMAGGRLVGRDDTPLTVVEGRPDDLVLGHQRSQGERGRLRIVE